MLSNSWTISSYAIILLSMCVSGDSQKIRSYQQREDFHNKKIVLDHWPIKSNSLVYGVCNSNYSTNLVCTVILESFSTEKTVDKKTCQIEYKTASSAVIKKDEFQLKLLYNNQVLFMWSILESNTNDSKISEQYAIFKIIDMFSCKTVESKIGHEISKQSIPDIHDFLIVPYINTFDVFFHNQSLCGDKMCGQTYNSRGKVVNGPVASYLPDELFKGVTLVYPADSRSSGMGHFLISTKLRLVSSYHGEVKDLMNVEELLLQTKAFSCISGYLGFCWISIYTKMQINCRQFDKRGERILNSNIELDYITGIWMDMYNLENGGFLLLTSECNEEIWCNENFDKVNFYVTKINRNGRVEHFHRFSDIDCNYGQNVIININKRNNGDVCVNFACYMEQNEGDSYLYLKSICINY